MEFLIIVGVVLAVVVSYFIGKAVGYDAGWAKHVEIVSNIQEARAEEVKAKAQVKPAVKSTAKKVTRKTAAKKTKATKKPATRKRTAKKSK